MSTISVNAEANLAQEEVEKDDIVLDANREVRAKLFIGSVRPQLSVVELAHDTKSGPSRFEIGSYGLVVVCACLPHGTRQVRTRAPQAHTERS